MTSQRPIKGFEGSRLDKMIFVLLDVLFILIFFQFHIYLFSLLKHDTHEEGRDAASGLHLSIIGINEIKTR